MRLHTLISLGSLVLLAAACESGWDVNGQVITGDAPDRNRPLYVYMVDAETIDPAALSTGSGSLYYQGLEQAPTIPGHDLPFEVHEFGCHRGAVAAVAWAPAAAPPPGAHGGFPTFAPHAGDYVVFSDVRHPYCGWQSHPESIVLVLDGRTTPSR